MRIYGSAVHAGGGYTGSHVPLPTTPRPIRQRPERAPVIVLQPLTKAEERALERRANKPQPRPRREVSTRKPQAAYHRIDDAEAAAIIDAYAGGMSLKAVARQFGRDAVSVRLHVKRAGILRSGGKRGPERKLDWNEAARLHAQGLTHRQIAEQLGSAKTTVQSALAVMRNRGEL